MPTLEEVVRRLSPGAIRIFKQQLPGRLKTMSLEQRGAFSTKLAGIPELAEIVGGQVPIAPRQPQVQAEQEVPMWMQGLETATAPLRWIEEEIGKPFGAMVTAPFTPAIPGTEGLPWYEREKAEYEAWEEPEFTMPWGGKFRPTKGIVETLPWFAIPSAAGIAARLGGVAGRGGMLAGAAKVGAQALKPLVAVEQAPFKLAGKAVSKLRPLATPVTAVASKEVKAKSLRALIAAADISIITKGHPLYADAKAAGGTFVKGKVYLPDRFSDIGLHEVAHDMLAKGTVPEEVMNIFKAEFKNWRRTKIGKKALEPRYYWKDEEEIFAEVFKRVAKDLDMKGFNKTVKSMDSWLRKEPVTPTIPKAPPPVGEPPAPPAPPAIPPTRAVPGGFTEPQAGIIARLTSLIKLAKPLRKKTEELYTVERGKRIGGFEETLEKLTIEGVPPEEALYKARGALAGEYPQAKAGAEFTALRGQMTDDELNVVFGIIRDADYPTSWARNNTSIAMQKLMLGKIPQRNELKLLEDTFGSGLVSEILKKQARWKIVRENIIDLLNAPRALLASVDISGLLRQGGVLTARHPVLASRSLKPMLQALFSDANEALVDSIIRARPRFALGDKYGLYMAPKAGEVSAILASREEAFMSRFMSKVPFVRASNRAYVTGLNDLRSRVWESVLESWERAGMKINAQDYSDLARLINWASGRGTLPSAVAQKGGVLNTFLFSPRLIMSRLELPFAVLPWVTKSKAARVEAWKTLASFVGAGSTILTMAKMSGAAEVELDPRSADFGKMKVGDTRLDIWTGYLQYIRFATQLAIAERKTGGGRIQQLNRAEVINRFVQTKMAPAVGLINDILKGESYLGEEMPPKNAKSLAGQAYNRMMPLAVQDFIDGIIQGGMLGGIVSSAAFLGIGVVTYTDEVKRARDKVARDTHGMTWEEVGQHYGRAEQLRLEQTSEAIIEAEKEQEDRFAAGTPTAMQHWRSEGEMVEESYRETIGQATREYKATGDGVLFRSKVDMAAGSRRAMYGARAKRKEYQDIIDYYNQTLSADQVAKMNPGDVLRREFYQIMFADDMYDQYGNYMFEEAERREQEFVRTYGPQALAYIEQYSEMSWLDKPAELRILDKAREILKPYWEIKTKTWAQYPDEWEELSRQIEIIARTDEIRAKRMLFRYPRLALIREQIARQRKILKLRNPDIAAALNMFYRY